MPDKLSIPKLPGPKDDEDEPTFILPEFRQQWFLGEAAPVPLPITDGLAAASLEMAAAQMPDPEVRPEGDVGKGTLGWTSTPPTKKLSAAKEEKLAEAIKRDSHSDPVVAFMRGAREKGSWSKQDANNLLSELESASSAGSDARQAEGEVKALQKALQTLKGKHPDRPSGAAQAFSLLLGGFPLEITGGYERERAFRRERDELTKRFWERRKSDLAVKEAGEKSKIAVKAAKDSRVRASVPISVDTAIATVLSRNTILEPNLGDPNPDLFLPKVWAPKILGTNPDLYEGKIINLIADINSEDPDPKSKSTMLALATIIKQREAKMTKQIEDWKADGKANMDIHGNYSGAIRKDVSPTAYHWALTGVTSAKLGVGTESYGRFKANRETAMFDLIQREMLQGSSKEDAENNVAKWMANGALASLYTSPKHMERTAKLVSSMGAYQKLTGERYGQHDKEALDIKLDKARLNAIRHKLSNDKNLPLKDRARLEKDALALSGNIALKETKKLTFSSAEVEQEIEEIKTLKAAVVAAAKGSLKERRDLVLYYKKAAGADYDEFRGLVDPDLIARLGGLEAFIEKVSLDKDGKIVKFDDETHKEAESWDRIIPDMRRSALSSFVQRVVTAYDVETRQPSEWREYVDSILNFPEEAKPPKRKLRGGTDRDAQFLAGLFAPGKNRGKFREVNEVDSDGRLNRYSLSRRQTLRLLARDVAMEEEANVRVARDLLTPELNDFEAYSPNVDYDGYTKLNTRAEVLNFIAKVDARKLVADPLGSGKKFRESIKKSQFKGKAANKALTDVLLANAGDKKKLELAIAKFLLEFWAQSAYETK